MSIGFSSDARKAARAQGAKTYEGYSCRHGHGTVRYVANGSCVECTKAHVRMAYDKATSAARKRAWRAKVKASAPAASALGADILESL